MRRVGATQQFRFRQQEPVDFLVIEEIDARGARLEEDRVRGRLVGSDSGRIAFAAGLIQTIDEPAATARIPNLSATRSPDSRCSARYTNENPPRPRYSVTRYFPIERPAST